MHRAPSSLRHGSARRLGQACAGRSRAPALRAALTAQGGRGAARPAPRGVVQRDQVGQVRERGVGRADVEQVAVAAQLLHDALVVQPLADRGRVLPAGRVGLGRLPPCEGRTDARAAARRRRGAAARPRARAGAAESSHGAACRHSRPPALVPKTDAGEQQSSHAFRRPGAGQADASARSAGTGSPRRAPMVAASAGAARCGERGGRAAHALSASSRRRSSERVGTRPSTAYARLRHQSLVFITSASAPYTPTCAWGMG